ncbi:MAG: hypothetical protein ACFCD0_24810 [Gemmataceae bacterium]
MTNIAKASWLSYVVFGTISVGVIGLILGCYGNVTKALSMQTDVDRADQLWDQGEHAKAAELYKKALTFENNPMVGRKIADADRPKFYARIIQSDILAKKLTSALNYAGAVLDKDLLTLVSVATNDPNTRHFLFNVREGRELLRMAKKLQDFAKDAPDVQSDEKSKLGYQLERKLRLKEFADVEFDAKVCPPQTAQIRKQLKQLIQTIPDPDVADAVRKRL